MKQALADLEAKASEKGYDGVLGVKISHPSVVDGGVEVVVYGNGCRIEEKKWEVESDQTNGKQSQNYMPSSP